MRKKLSGLSAKLIASVLLLSVLLCGAISYMGYREFTRVLEAEYNRPPTRSPRRPGPI